MMETRKTYTAEFQREAVRLVTEQRYGVAETARNLGMNVHMVRHWKQEYTANTPAAFPGNGRLTPEQAALRQLRDEIKRLRMERDIVKNLLRRACASLVGGETRPTRVSYRGERRDRLRIGGRTTP